MNVVASILQLVGLLALLVIIALLGPWAWAIAASLIVFGTGLLLEK